MNFHGVFFVTTGFAVLLSGCGIEKSVQRIDLQDSADMGFIQVNKDLSHREKLQLEVHQIKANAPMQVGSARSATGEGEERIRDANSSGTDLVGVGGVSARFEIQQATARYSYLTDRTGRYTQSFSANVSVLHMDSEYKAAQDTLNIDPISKGGIGLGYLGSWKINDKVSLNFSAARTNYQAKVTGTYWSGFVRIQPAKFYYVDIGAHQSLFNFGTETGVVYERRVAGESSCFQCDYIYNVTEKSDVDLRTDGIRIGIGFNL